MSPIGFAEGSSIGHQYGREHYDVGVDEVIKLRSLDRELSGFAPLANSYNRS